MKSLKSLFALFAIVALSFGCASVTDASQMDQELSEPAETTIFSGGNDVTPIIERPEI